MTAGGPLPGAPTSVGVGAPPADGRGLLDRLSAAIGQEIVGYREVVRALAVALVAEGHVLLEGVPGLAKTSLVRAFSQSLRLEFRRIQFTPDMLPSDILGATVLRTADQTFEFRPGPIFANVILADEINRAPPKVQSALLEAMQERQVTVEGTSHPLPRPFVVIATQNPIEQEGTYPLPEAELDRFLFRWIVSYPSLAEEVAILKTRAAAANGSRVVPVVEPGEVEALRVAARSVHLGDDLFAYLAGVVRQTRADPRLLIGASPRASVQFLAAVRAHALLDGRTYVVPDDIRELAFPVLNHRVLLRPEALVETAGLTDLLGPLRRLRELLRQDVDAVPVPR